MRTPLGHLSTLTSHSPSPEDHFRSLHSHPHLSLDSLGFSTASGTFRLPPNLVDECIESLIRIKKLPLTIAGRMTVIAAYIRPKLFYRLSITPTRDIESYRFISSSKDFDPTAGVRATFSDAKLGHPAFHFRLCPLSLALQLSRFPTPQ